MKKSKQKREDRMELFGAQELSKGNCSTKLYDTYGILNQKIKTFQKLQPTQQAIPTLNDASRLTHMCD